MSSFVIHNPVRLMFGRGQVDALGPQVPDGARVLLVTGGGSVERNGTLARVLDQLEGRAAVIEHLRGVQPNPEYEQLMAGVALARQRDLDLVLAVGGGSVIDGAKFIAAAARFEGDDPWAILASRATVASALPLGVVLTLPATGSEMNHLSVVSRSELGLKLSFASEHVYPRFAIVDPDVTVSLPQWQVANGVVDAFVHVLEQYVTPPVEAPLQERFAESVLQTLVEYGPRTWTNPQDAPARDAVCHAATWALNGVVGAGVPQDWSTHMIGHELTALYGLDHARSLAAVLFQNFELRMESKVWRLAQLAERVWGVRSGTELERAQLGLERTRAFFRQLGVATSLAEYPDVRDDVADVVVARLAERGITRLGEGRSVDLELVRRIVQTSRHG